MSRRCIQIACCSILLLAANISTRAHADEFEFGFAKADVTPTEPLRLSGYGSRTEPFVGIDEQLHVRAMAIRDENGQLCALVTVDTIGLPGTLVKSIAKAVEQRHGISRAELAICFTHTHTAPHITNGLTNIFSKPLTTEERDKSQKYTEKLAQQTIKCVGEAITQLAPGTLQFGVGQVRFARNRRVLKDGIWVGFGENPDGPVDHSFPLLKICGPDGAVRGVVFNYACHCTTFGGNDNRVNGDWAGYATQYVEQAFPGTLALCTIGCGADANPPRDRDRAKEFAKAEGKEILEQVTLLIDSQMQPITQPLSTSFGYADLPIDRPSIEDLKKRLEDGRAQTRVHAHNMLAIHERQGQLPVAYSAPIQAWKFGDQLTMVFMSGEVVVDYALRLKRELAPKNVWVSAYANDLFAYVASERMRKEGGYEVEGSMIYYNQPGPWAKGTEELLMQRIYELLK